MDGLAAFQILQKLIIAPAALARPPVCQSGPDRDDASILNNTVHAGGSPDVIASAASMIDEDLVPARFSGEAEGMLSGSKWQSSTQRRFIATLSMALNPDQ
jgi:hypothetical protein